MPAPSDPSAFDILTSHSIGQSQAKSTHTFGERDTAPGKQAPHMDFANRTTPKKSTLSVNAPWPFSTVEAMQMGPGKVDLINLKRGKAQVHYAREPALGLRRGFLSTQGPVSMHIRTCIPSGVTGCGQDRINEPYTDIEHIHSLFSANPKLEDFSISGFTPPQWTLKPASTNDRGEKQYL